MRKLQRVIYSPYFLVLLFGILLRLFVAPFTLNWDLLANTQLAVKFLQLPLNDFYQLPLSAYPPIMYRVQNIFIDIFRPLLGSHFENWLSTPGLNALFQPEIFRILFFLKAPYIILELATILIITATVSEKNRFFTFLLLMANPLGIYLVSCWTNVDIIPMFFISVYWFCLSKKMSHFAGIFLSISAAFKLFSIFLFPFYIFSGEGIGEKFKRFLIVTIPFGLSQISSLSLAAYRNHSITGGYSNKILFSVLPIGENRVIILLLFFYCLLFFHFFTTKKREMQLFDYTFYVFLLFFAFSAFSLQWFLWILLSLVIYFVQIPKIRVHIVGIYFAYTCMLLLSQPSLNISMFAPIEPTVWNINYFIVQIFSQEKVTMVFNYLHTAIASTLLWSGYSVFTINNRNK